MIDEQTILPVYIGSADRFAIAEKAILNSIRENTTGEVDVKIIRPNYIGMRETGCTGFSMVRFAVPHLLRRDGYPFGIYLDVDMIVRGDLNELRIYRKEKVYSCMFDGSTEVGVISAECKPPDITALSYFKKNDMRHYFSFNRIIPHIWNVEDSFQPYAKIVHFTDLKTQPYFFNNHPNQKAVNLYHYYANK